MLSFPPDYKSDEHTGDPAAVRGPLEVPGARTRPRFAESPHYGGPFGASDYYAEYVPRYTTGSPFPYYANRPHEAWSLLTFVFTNG